MSRHICADCGANPTLYPCHAQACPFLEQAQRRNPPMDMERWSKMDPLEVYWEIEAIRAKLKEPAS